MLKEEEHWLKNKASTENFKTQKEKRGGYKKKLNLKTKEEEIMKQ